MGSPSPKNFKSSISLSGEKEYCKMLHSAVYAGNYVLTNISNGASLSIYSGDNFFKTIDGNKCIDGYFSDFD